MDNKYVKIHTAGCNVPLKITPGHFAANHAHINYYIDMTTLKTRLSEGTGDSQKPGGNVSLWHGTKELKPYSTMAAF